MPASWLQKIKDDKGVTLIELVVVLMVFAIMGNMVSVSFSSQEKRALNKACMQLQSDIRLAQRLSVIKGVKHFVVFDGINNSYKVRYQNEGGFVSYTNVRYEDFQDGISLKSINKVTANTITYTKTGTSGDACTIVLNSEHYAVDLTINVGSGRIEVKEFTKRAKYT